MRVPSYDELNQFYGNPDADGDGLPSVKWETENLTTIVPPFPMFWAWSLSPVKSIKIHKKCAESLFEVLSVIDRGIPHPVRVKTHLNRCGGAYNFRTMRGNSKRLSTHSWGCAIDLAPELNWLGRTYGPDKGMMPMVAVNAFQDAGWTWGGTWRKADAMHFQFCK